MSIDRKHAHRGSHGPAVSAGSSGSPGKRTQVELLSQAAGAQEGVSPGPKAGTSASGGVSAPGPRAPSIELVRSGVAVIQFTQHGNSVKRIQRHLKDVKVNGHFNKETLAAVRAFQKEHDLVVDGIVGVQTISLLIPDTDRDDSDGSSSGGVGPDDDSPDGDRPDGLPSGGVGQDGPVPAPTGGVAAGD